MSKRKQTKPTALAPKAHPPEYLAALARDCPRCGVLAGTLCIGLAMPIRDNSLHPQRYDPR